MEKTFILTLMFAAALIFPSLAQAAPKCSGNTTPSLSLGDPACRTTSTTGSVDWKKTGRKWITTCRWTLDCAKCPYPCGDRSGRACKANFYTSNGASGCPGSRWCSNMGSPPSGYWKDTYGWVDNRSTTNKCYYTTVGSWGAPDAIGRRLAATVTRESTSGKNCTSESTVSYVNPIPDLKVEGSDIAITVDKAVGISGIDWASTYATSCSVPVSNTGVGWSGAKSLNGTQGLTDISSTPKPATPTAAATTMDYKISCTNPGLVNIVDTVSVTVTCVPELNPAWSVCDETCGGGIQYRTALYANCHEELQNRVCNIHSCPKPTGWKETEN